MTRPLTVHNAQITTAAVEVKTLTISGKQVTLAVFRQLREEPLIADDGTLNGVPWGTVNYHPDKCGNADQADHWHVVWQRGSDLLRSRVDTGPEYDRRAGDFGPESGDVFYDACVRAALFGSPHPGYFKGDPLASGANQLRWVTQRGIHSLLEMRDDTFQAVEFAKHLHDARGRADDERATYGDTDDSQHSWYRKQLPGTEARFAEAVKQLADSPPSHGRIAELFEAYDAEMEAEAERRQRHRRVRKAINDLPQLFIAV